MNEETSKPRRKRLQRKDLALFLLPLCVFGFYLAALRVHNAFLPPKNPTSFLMSPAIVSPDGHCTAQIILWEHEPEGNEYALVPDDIDHGNTSWSLRVTRSDGSQCNLRLIRYEWDDELSESELKAMRKVPCSVAWDKSGRFLTYQLPRSTSGKSVYLDTCLRPWKSTNGMNFQVFIGNKAKPLTADLQKRLTRRGCSAKEIASLKYVQLQGEYYGADMKDFINWHRNVLLVVGPHFSTHGQIISLGPVLTIGEAYFMGAIASQQWIFFDDRSSTSSDKVDGSQIFISLTVGPNRVSSVGKPKFIP